MLRLGNKAFAVIGSSDINEPFTEGQISLLRQVRDVLQLAFSQSIDFKSTIDYIYYIEALIKGTTVDEKILAYHLKSRHWKLDDDYCVYHIADSSGNALSEGQIEFCIYRVKSALPEAMIFSYENAVNIIRRMPKHSADEPLDEALKAFLEGSGLRCGRSVVFSRFSDLKYYYIQSKVALSQGIQANAAGCVFLYKDYYMHHVMDSLDNATSLKSICHPGVLKLYEHDVAAHTDLIKSLRIYMFTGCNMTQTAKLLFMHRNTFEYRLNRILDMLELDLNSLDEQGRTHIWFSCLICEHLKKP